MSENQSVEVTAATNSKGITMDSITLTIGQIADLLQVKPLTIRRMWIQKTFPAPVQVARLIRWRKSDVEKWLAEQPTSDRYETKV